jgi:hypothetical protein
MLVDQLETMMVGRLECWKVGLKAGCLVDMLVDMKVY